MRGGEGKSQSHDRRCEVDLGIGEKLEGGEGRSFKRNLNVSFLHFSSQSCYEANYAWPQIGFRPSRKAGQIERGHEKFDESRSVRKIDFYSPLFRVHFLCAVIFQRVAVFLFFFLLFFLFPVHILEMETTRQRNGVLFRVFFFFFYFRFSWHGIRYFPFSSTGTNHACSRLDGMVPFERTDSLLETFRLVHFAKGIENFDVTTSSFFLFSLSPFDFCNRVKKKFQLPVHLEKSSLFIVWMCE